MQTGILPMCQTYGLNFLKGSKKRGVVKIFFVLFSFPFVFFCY